ncbi:hypothetical protein AURDEDRAFT_162958 [Auricularia subglabra TFB-10046 SS5]|nr:hypothetical protein AURDEDRAFT_162958 [Auricularia subglabra TFB-10046 SS5]
MSSAAATKERLYVQLATKLGRFSAALERTARSTNQLKTDVQAMQVLAGLHAAQFMAVARVVDIEDELAVAAEECVPKRTGSSAY